MHTLWLSALLLGEAEAGSLFGGRVAESNQVYFHVGYPTTEVGFHLPVGDRFEVTPWARFRYGWGTFVGGLWTGPGIDLRAQVYSKDELSVALLFSFGSEFLLNGGYFGAQLSLGHPGAMVSWGLTDELDLDFGLRVQPWLLVGDFINPSLSIPAFFGVTFELGDGIELGFRAHGGPWFDLDDPDDLDVDADVGALFFMGFAL
jgi:hypothetical protein